MELNPREFVPAPAQGVLAWQTHRDDLPTRRILKQLHHPEISAVTNIERRVLQLMDGGCQLPLGVHATRDDAGNYHVFAACEIAGELRQAQISQSTSFGLAEKIVEQLQKVKM
jgi:hydroxymethylbilane synthase